MPTQPLDSETTAKAQPSFLPVPVGETKEVRENVAEVVSVPEEQRAAAKALTAAGTFVLSYLARTPLGLAEGPKTVGERALAATKGVAQKIPVIGTGITVWDQMKGWMEKSFSTHPPAAALVAWASSMMVLGIALGKTPKKWKWGIWATGIPITRLAIGAIEQWGSNETLNWTAGGLTVSAAAVMTGMAIHKKEWWNNLRIALRSGMGAAWEFLNRDIMPGPAAREEDEEETPRRPRVRPKRPAAPAGARPAGRAAEGGETTRRARPEGAPTPPCASCGANDLEDRPFCQHCGTKRQAIVTMGDLED